MKEDKNNLKKSSSFYECVNILEMIKKMLMLDAYMRETCARGMKWKLIISWNHWKIDNFPSSSNTCFLWFILFYLFFCWKISKLPWIWKNNYIVNCKNKKKIRKRKIQKKKFLLLQKKPQKSSLWIFFIILYAMSTLSSFCSVIVAIVDIFHQIYVGR